MNAAIKQRWLKALRSGKYKQAKRRLAIHNHETREPEGFCCLGVLCEIAVEDGVITKTLAEGYHQGQRVLHGAYRPAGQWHGDGERGALPEAVRRWAGVDSNNPDVRLRESVPLAHGPGAHYRRGDVVGLATCNDILGFDFNQIAALIEEQL